MSNQPNYYAIVPAEVRYSKISANAKLLYGELTALSNKEGYCWASNQYFADLYEVDARTVSRWVSDLVDNNFITTNVENYNERKIYLVAGVGKNCRGGTTKISKGVRQKAEHNNTVNNKTNTGEQSSQDEIRIVKDDESKPKKKEPQVALEVFQVFSDVIGKNPLNWRTNKTQRTCAENLYKERGLGSIRRALEFYVENRGDKFCPSINSPYDLDSKWSNLYEFKEKHYGD
jgi:hypothetical protein